MVKVVLDRQGNGLYFSRSPIPYVRNDGLSPTFYRHQGIYGYSTKFLLQFVKWKPGLLEQAESLEQLRALENGARIRVILAKRAAVGVDTPEDVAVVERILAEGSVRRNGILPLSRKSGRTPLPTDSLARAWAASHRIASVASALGQLEKRLRRSQLTGRCPAAPRAGCTRS